MRRRDAYVELHNLDKFEDLPDEIEDEFLETRAHAFCAYPLCGKPWLLTEEKSPLKACSKCKWTYYCSVRICSFFLSAYLRLEIMFAARMSEEGLAAPQDRVQMRQVIRVRWVLQLGLCRIMGKKASTKICPTICTIMEN